MTNIILVGSVHTDYKGPERLMAVYQHFKPNIIAIESTPVNATSAYHFFLEEQKQYSILSSNPEFSKLYTPEQITRLQKIKNACGFEIWVPRKYKELNPNTRLVCIDKEAKLYMPQSSQNTTRTSTPNIVTKESIEKLTEPSLKPIEGLIQTGFEESQKRIDDAYEKDHSQEIANTYGIKGFEIIVKQREMHFANQIHSLTEKNPNNTIVAVVGNSHIYGNHIPNLYELILTLDPIRMKLKDADKL